MRTGSDYTAALADDRAVYVDGQRVSDVADHPAFSGVVATMASLYDAAAREGSDLVDPETGQLGFFTVPRTWEQHELRKRSLEGWSRLAHGFIGRGPDHVAGLLAGFSSHPDLFDTDRHQLGKHVLDYSSEAAAKAAESGAKAGDQSGKPPRRDIRGKRAGGA